MHELFPPLMAITANRPDVPFSLDDVGICSPVCMQSRWCRAWSRPNLTDFVHIFSKRGYLQCVFVHWRDLETKSKSTAYLLENWNSSTTAPDALFSLMGIDDVLGSLLLFVLVVLPLRCCFECLHSPRVPTFGKSPFSPHKGFWCRRSTALSSSWVSNLGESTAYGQGDKSKLWSIEVRVRGPTLPATRSNHQVVSRLYFTVTTAYNRTILSGTAASAQYTMAKAALHLNTKKILEIEKEIVREVARGDKPYMRKSADRKAQIRKALVSLTGLICALQSADFLGWCLSPKRNLTHNLFFYFQ